MRVDQQISPAQKCLDFPPEIMHFSRRECYHNIVS